MGIFAWLSALVRGVPTRPLAERQQAENDARARMPLTFDYRAKDGTLSQVILSPWTQNGEYVRGRSLTHDREITYKLDRIVRFRDLSYRQLRNYRAPSNSPLDPKRLP